VGAAIMLFSGMAGAALSQVGPTGVVATPTAEVTPHGYYDVAMGYVNRDFNGTSLKEWPLRLTIGISEKAELGASYLQIRNGESLRVVGLNGKVVLSGETESMPALAAGVVYGKSSDFDYTLLFPSLLGTGDIKATSVYLVATKTLSRPGVEYDLYGDPQPVGNIVRGSLGITHNRYSFKGTGIDDSTTETRPFLNLEFVSAKGSVLALEYRAKEGDISDDPVSSAVLRHPFSPGFWVEVGITNAIHTIADKDHEFFAGMQYRWGATEEEHYY
jgi:hypothetical protein